MTTNRRRRRIVSIALALLVPAPIFFACSFPEVTFTTPGAQEAGLGGDVGDASATGDVRSIQDADIGEIVTYDGASIDAKSCSSKPVPCDCDNDNYLADGCDASGTDASGKQQGDCDDLNDFVHPNQIYSDSPPLPGTGPGKGGDWDCSKTVEKGFKDDAWCKGSIVNLIVTCAGGTGFARTVGCGEEADLNTCEKDSFGTGCHLEFKENKKQACK